MSVKKQKNGKWLCQIDREGLKRVRRTFESQKEAAIFEREYLFGFTPSKRVIHDPRTLIELINIWYQYHGVTLANPDGLKNQMIAAAEAMGNPIAHSLTPEALIKLRFNRTVKNEKTITGKTFNNIHSLLSSMFNKLKKLKVIDYENPILEVDKLRLQEQQMSYLSIEQINELIESIESKSRNASTLLVASICLRTGARWGEAETLCVKHLHNSRITYENTKSKKVRTIPVDETFFEKIKAFAEGKNPEDRIFENCYNSCRKAIKRTGIILPKGQLTHVFRHTFASHFMMRNGNILTLQKILGHSDIKMTMRYAHFAPNHLQDAVVLNPLA